MVNNVNDTIIGMVTDMTMPVTPKAYSQVFTLATGTDIALDFKTLVSQNKVDQIQGVFVDNSAGTTAATVKVNATLQTFSIPAGYQGICPLYVTQDMTFTLSGNGNVPVIFVNFPCPAAVWKAS